MRTKRKRKMNPEEPWQQWVLGVEFFNSEKLDNGWEKWINPSKATLPQINYHWRLSVGLGILHSNLLSRYKLKKIIDYHPHKNSIMDRSHKGSVGEHLTSICSASFKDEKRRKKSYGQTVQDKGKYHHHENIEEEVKSERYL